MIREREFEVARRLSGRGWIIPMSPEPPMEGYYLLSYSALEFITTFNPDRVLELLQENQRLRSDLESAKDLADDYNEEIVASHARLAAVEKQHLPRCDLAHPKHGSPICDGCGGDEEGWAPPWPCPTVTAVRGE